MTRKVTDKEGINKFPSELRYDTISEDWVVIATGRAKRPDAFKSKRKKETASQKDCVFCDAAIKKQEPPTLIFKNKVGQSLERGIPEDWTLVVIPNKYPAFMPSNDLDVRAFGQFYRAVNAAGFHEVIVMREHDKHIATMDIDTIDELLAAYQLRYLGLKEERFVNNISIFHNYGSEAGASIAHPHSQLATTPLVDADLKKALINAREYYEHNQSCAYCAMNDYECEVQERMVFENAGFQVVCPFASRSAFQMIISPKKHEPYFEGISEEDRLLLAEAFKQALGKLHKGLDDPPYNFYLHTAPPDGSEHEYYHYHWTIVPKTSTWAGFEIGTRMEISTIEPEQAAAYLKSQEI